MERLQAFMTSRVMGEHLQYMINHYKIPSEAVRYLANEIAHKESDTEDTDQKIYIGWCDSIQNIFGFSPYCTVKRQITHVLESLQEARKEMQKCKDNTFQEVVDQHLHRTHDYARHIIWQNEGRKYDINHDVNFWDRNDPPRPSAHVTHVANYGGTKCTHVRFRLKPSYKKRVPVHLAVLTKGKNKLFVLDAERIHDHAFESEGIHVFRAPVFGENAEGEVGQWMTYILEHQTMRDGDGVPMFSHGDTVAGAKSLLDRRIKRETLSQLGF